MLLIEIPKLWLVDGQAILGSKLMCIETCISWAGKMPDPQEYERKRGFRMR